MKPLRRPELYSTGPEVAATLRKLAEEMEEEAYVAVKVEFRFASKERYDAAMKAKEPGRGRGTTARGAPPAPRGRLDRAKVLDLFNSGRWPADIAAELGCSRERVRQILKAEGGPTKHEKTMACPRCGKRCGVRTGACFQCRAAVERLGAETIEDLPPIRVPVRGLCAGGCGKELVPGLIWRGMCQSCRQRTNYQERPDRREAQKKASARWKKKAMADPAKRARLLRLQKEATARYLARKKQAADANP